MTAKDRLEPLLVLEDEPTFHHDEDSLNLTSYADIVAGAAVGTQQVRSEYWKLLAADVHR